MSGRLVILPKKSWNVWNPANIARVRRDEEAARKAAESTTRDEQRQRMGQAISRMKGSSAKSEEDRTLYDARGHVNLFTREERLEASMTGGLTEEEKVEQDEQNIKRRRKLGMFAAPVPLKDAAASDPWYSRPKELELTARDPAGHPTPTVPTALPPAPWPPQRSDRKKRKSGKRESDDWFANLRRRRLEREAHESKRAARLLAHHDSGGDLRQTLA